MSGNMLLDTNIVIAIFGNDENVISKLSDIKNIFIPSIVIGELYYGAYKSKNVKSNVSHIKKFAEDLPVLNCDSNTALYYGAIKNKLRAKGKPIPENDIWIAALSVQYNLTLISRDVHFKEVEDLSVLDW